MFVCFFIFQFIKIAFIINEVVSFLIQFESNFIIFQSTYSKQYIFVITCFSSFFLARNTFNFSCSQLFSTFCSTFFQITNQIKKRGVKMDEDDIEQYKNDLKDLKSNQKPLINMLSQGTHLSGSLLTLNFILSCRRLQGHGWSRNHLPAD